MLIFWTLTGLACALAGLLILSAAGAAGGAAASGPEEDEAARGRALARDLEELDRMAARGVLAGAELEAARAEVALNPSKVTVANIKTTGAKTSFVTGSFRPSPMANGRRLISRSPER